MKLILVALVFLGCQAPTKYILVTPEQREKIIQDETRLELTYDPTWQEMMRQLRSNK